MMCARGVAASDSRMGTVRRRVIAFDYGIEQPQNGAPAARLVHPARPEQTRVDGDRAVSACTRNLALRRGLSMGNTGHRRLAARVGRNWCRVAPRWDWWAQARLDRS